MPHNTYTLFQKRSTMFHLSNSCIAFCALITSLNLFTMDAPPVITLREITAVRNPTLVVALKNNNAAIAHPNGCTIIEIKTNRIVRDIQLPNIKRLITNKNKTLLGIDTSDSCSLYCVKKREFLWKAPIGLFDPSTFTANNTLWSYNQKNACFINSRSGKYERCPKNLNMDMCAHPTEKKIFCSRGIYNEKKDTYQNFLYIFTMMEKNKHRTEKIELPKEISPNKLGNGILIKDCSPIGNLLALYSPIDCGWSLYNYEKKEIVIDTSGYNNLALHPSKPLAALLTQQGELLFYNIQNNEILASTQLKVQPYPSTTAINQTTMSFSGDGNALIFICRNKCYMANIAPIIT